MRYWVYILVNPEGKIYVGHTNNLDRRLAQHNNADFFGTLHTKRHPGPWRLLHTKSFASRGDAMLRERALKGGQGRQWIRMQLMGGC